MRSAARPSRASRPYTPVHPRMPERLLNCRRPREGALCRRAAARLPIAPTPASVHSLPRPAPMRRSGSDLTGPPHLTRRSDWVVGPEPNPGGRSIPDPRSPTVASRATAAPSADEARPRQRSPSKPSITALTAQGGESGASIRKANAVMSAGRTSTIFPPRARPRTTFTDALHPRRAHRAQNRRSLTPARRAASP